MFEKFKSDHKRNATVPISQVKNIKGHLNAGIDPKINHFLVKTQRNLMETQPLMKR